MFDVPAQGPSAGPREPHHGAAAGGTVDGSFSQRAQYRKEHTLNGTRVINNMI